MTGKDNSTCSIPGCGNRRRARGYCSTHWGRWRKTGDPLKTSRPAELHLSGERFGRLVVLKDTGERKPRGKVWLCMCECGSLTKVVTGNLRSGNTTSCGCYQRERARAVNTKHGHSHNHADGVCSTGQSRAYACWWSMIARCKYESTHAYPWYGGRGIKVCERWSGDGGFANFLSDMGEHPGEGWSIDRVDPDGHYEPRNCRWLLMSLNAARGRKSGPSVANSYVERGAGEGSRNSNRCGAGASGPDLP